MANKEEPTSSTSEEEEESCHSDTEREDLNQQDQEEYDWKNSAQELDEHQALQWLDTLDPHKLEMRRKFPLKYKPDTLKKIEESIKRERMIELAKAEYESKKRAKERLMGIACDPPAPFWETEELTPQELKDQAVRWLDSLEPQKPILPPCNLPKSRFKKSAETGMHTVISKHKTHPKFKQIEDALSSEQPKEMGNPPVLSKHKTHPKFKQIEDALGSEQPGLEDGEYGGCLPSEESARRYKGQETQSLYNAKETEDKVTLTTEEVKSPLKAAANRLKKFGFAARSFIKDQLEGKKKK